MTHVDLFSGIGGFSLAAGWAGFETVLFVENNDYCQRVLKKHWPNVPCIGDIRDVNEETVADAANKRQGSGASKRWSIEDRQRWDAVGIEPVGRGSGQVATAEGLPTIDLLTGGDASGRKVCEGSKGLRDGIVDTGLGRPLQSHTPDDVEDIETARMRVSEQLEIWGSKPFLQGDTCVGQGSEQVGTSDRGRGSCPTNSVPGVQENREVQERTTDDTGSPHRLREAVGSDVAMSEMPPRMAQEISGKGGDKTGIRSDSNNVATWGGIDLLTGGFP